MRILTVTKRRTSGKDLLVDRFGRYFHLPMELSRLASASLVVAADYEVGPSKAASFEGCEFVSLPLSLKRVASYWRETKAKAREFAPDLILAGGDTHLGWAGHRLARSLDVPFVFDVFDNYAAFESARIPGMKRVFRSLPKVAHLTVVVSEPLRLLLGQPEKTCVIPNGVDMNLFHPHVPKAITSTSPLVVYVGGLAESRGTTTLIEAIDSIRQRHPNIRLLLAGPILDSYRLPEAHWIEYLGFVQQADVPSLLTSADVAVLPYPDTEWARYTSAYKLGEYFACEIPVVVTDISNYRDMAPAPEAVCKPGDPNDMARAISFQLKHRANAGRDLSWSWSSKAQDLYQRFASLL
jgi:glycosyltransferase involved in cell wall biosynthesis